MRIVVTYLLVILLSHVPVPWVHCHKNVSAEQLPAHLKLAHIRGKAVDPAGWHLHFYHVGELPLVGLPGWHAPPAGPQEWDNESAESILDAVEYAVRLAATVDESYSCDAISTGETSSRSDGSRFEFWRTLCARFEGDCYLKPAVLRL